MRLACRRSAMVIPVIMAAMLALSSGHACATIVGLGINYPSGVYPVPLRAGDSVTIVGTVYSDVGDVVNMAFTIGSETVNLNGVAVGGDGQEEFSVQLTIAGDEAEGLKDLHARAYATSDPIAVLNVGVNDAVLVDMTIPELQSLGLEQPERYLFFRQFSPTGDVVLNVIVRDRSVLGIPASGFHQSGFLGVDVFEDDGGTPTGPVLGSLESVTVPVDGDDPWEAQWRPTNPMHDGRYYARVAFTDGAGNSRIVTGFSFSVDSTPPSLGGAEAVLMGMNQNSDNSRWFTNSRNVTASWAAATDPAAPDLSEGSGLLGYWFTVWTKAEEDPSPTGIVLYAGSSDTDSWEGPLDYMRPSGSTTEWWSTDHLLELVSGQSYGVWITAWDMMHNQSDWFDPPFIFDPDPPTDPGTPEVLDLVDPMADRRIADSTPVFAWLHSSDLKPIAQSGVGAYEVQIALAGTGAWDVLDVTVDIPDEDVDLLNADDAPLSGPFSWAVPIALPDGAYEVRVRAKDVAGNFSDWAYVPAFEIDTTPPPVPGMPATDNPTNNQNPAWAWTAGSGSEGSGLAAFGVYEDGVSKGTVLDPTFTSAGLGEGVHVLEVTAVDDLGNESVRSTPGHVLIDLTAPAVPQMAALPPFTKATALLLDWTAVDGAVSYELETSIAGVTTATPGIPVPVFLLDLGAAVNGNVLTAKVRATDGVGNTSGWSGEVTTTIDRTAPDIVITLPASPTNDPRPTWSWVGSDGISAVDYYLVALDAEPAFETGDSIYQPASDLSEGLHVLRLKAADLAGNVSDWFYSDSVTIDTTPPAVPGIPRPDETPTKNTTPGWTWTASADATSYNVYLDDGLIASVAVPEFTSADYGSFSVAPLAEGIHHVQVTAVDAVGNESDMSGTGHVIIDLTPPRVPELDPLPPFTNSASVRFVWTAVDGAVSYDLEGAADTLDIPAYTLDISAADDGDVVAARVRAYDGVGNVSAWSGQVSTIIDRTGPATAAVAAPPDMTNDTRPTWEWIGDDAGLSGVAYYTVTLDGQPPFNTTGTSFTPAHDLPAGGHTLTVQAVDALGNIGAPLVFATVVVVEPIVVDVNPLPGAFPINRLSTVVITLTGMVDAEVEVAVGGIWLKDWRVVEISRALASSKFYVLLDEAVLVPGRLVLTVNAGMTQEKFLYDVLNERSGFGFGRLRAW